MRKVALLCLLTMSLVSLLGQNDNMLNRMLGECIIKSKNKYESSPYLTNWDKPLLLCCDGLPNPYIGNSKLFYDIVGLQTMSWSNTKKYRKELKRGINVMEVSHGIVGNVLEIRVSMSTVKQDGNNIKHEYWFEDVDKYIYEYFCESNEWRLVSAAKYYDHDSGSFASISQDSIAFVCQRQNNQYFYYGCYRMENDTMILSENLIKRIEDTTDKEKKKGHDKGVYLVKQNEISRRALSPKEVTIVFDRENNSLVVSLSAYQQVQTTSKFVFSGCEDSCLLLVRKRFPYLSLQLQKDNSEHQRMRQK